MSNLTHSAGPTFSYKNRLWLAAHVSILTRMKVSPMGLLMVLVTVAVSVAVLSRVPKVGDFVFNRQAAA